MYAISLEYERTKEEKRREEEMMLKKEIEKEKEKQRLDKYKVLYTPV